MKRLLICCLLVALCALSACQRPPGAGGGARGRPPAFEVETWDGQRLEGALAMDAERVRVGRGRVGRESVRIVRRQTADVQASAARVPGFEPLTDDQLEQYRERAMAAAAKHAGSDSVVCLDYGQDSLMPGGGQLYRYHALVLVLKDEARKVADLSLGFSEGRSRRRVFHARSIDPQGRSQWLDLATMKVATPSEQAQFLNTRRRALSGRIPGVEIGSLVEYAYEYDYYNPDVPDYFFPSFLFQGEEPVLDSIIDVRVPAGRKLNWTTRNMPKKAQEPARSTQAAGEPPAPLDVYRWELHDVAPYTPEPMMPDRGDIAPVVHCSLFFSWDDLHTRTGGYQRERVEKTPQIAALAKKIVGDAKTDDEKLAAIYHWVQRNVNYLSIKGSLSSGWAGHPASETLKNGYGDCTDKAIVLASLSEAVGIKSVPAILQTNDAGRAVTEIPIPDANHCISLVYPNGKPRFIDSTASNYRYPYFRADDHGVKAVIHMEGKVIDIPVPPPEDNQRVSDQELALAADGGATGVERNAYNGTYEAMVRGFWRRVPPQLRGPMMQQYLQRRAPNARCTGFSLGELDDLTKQLTMEIRYRVANLATRTRDLYVVTPPGFVREFPEAALPTRTFDIERPTTQGYRTTIKVATPPGYRLAGVPKPLAIHGKHLWYEGRVEAAPDGASLTIHEQFKVLTRIVPKADYGAYRANATRIAAWSRLKLVYQKTAEAAARRAAR